MKKARVIDVKMIETAVEKGKLEAMRMGNYAGI